MKLCEDILDRRRTVPASWLRTAHNWLNVELNINPRVEVSGTTQVVAGAGHWRSVFAEVQQVSLFARYFDRSPEALGPEAIRLYQVYLTNEKKLSPGSILMAVEALRFLYKVGSSRMEDV